MWIVLTTIKRKEKKRAEQSHVVVTIANFFARILPQLFIFFLSLLGFPFLHAKYVFLIFLGKFYKYFNQPSLNGPILSNFIHPYSSLFFQSWSHHLSSGIYFLSTLKKYSMYLCLCLVFTHLKCYHLPLPHLPRDSSACL